MRLLAACIAVLLGGAGSFLFAQRPFGLPPDFVQERLHQRGDRIVFCFHADRPTAGFDKAVGEELANALLVEPQFVEFSPRVRTPPLDYRLYMDEEETYILLVDRCDAFVGFTLVEEVAQEWLTFTRPYYHSPFVFAVANPDYQRLQDIPAGSPIGTRLLSAAHIRFSAFLQSLPSDARWRSVPYVDNERLFERLLDGSVEGIIVWAPALHVLEQTELGHEASSESDVDLYVIESDPFPGVEVTFTIALRERDAFLRTMLDEALVAVIEDGTIHALLEEYGLPGEAGRLGP